MNDFIEWLLGIRPGTAAESGGVWNFAFTAEFDGYIKLILMLAFAALVYLTVRSYRKEGSAPKKAKIFLASVRILILILAFSALLQPAMVLTVSKTLYKSIVVLVDDSRSMSFTDKYADDEQRKELCDFLDVTPDRLEKMSRSEIVREALSRDDGPVKKLAKDHPIEVMSFSTTQPGKEAYTRTIGSIDTVTSSANPDDGNASATTQPTSVPEILANLNPAGYETNLSEALRDVYERMQGKRLAGIVMVSDFQMTSSGAAGKLAGATSYGDQRGIRRFPVIVGDTVPPRNVSVTSLEAPREVWAKSGVEMTATITHRNLAGQSVTVKLLRKPKTPQDSPKEQWTDTGAGKTITLEKTSQDESGIPIGVQKVTMSIEPETLGEFLYKAEVEPVPLELTVKDNSFTVPMKVTANKINVLLISGDAGKEFQFIYNALSRQEELFRISVWQQNADPEVNQSASSGMKLTKLPRTLEELMGSPGGKPFPGYRVVILYDPEPTANGFDEKFVNLLKDFVAKRNGGLCYIASNKHSEQILDNSAFKSLWDMLPVVLARGMAKKGDFEILSEKEQQSWKMRLTSYGMDHPITRLGSSSEQSAKKWKILPGVFWSHLVEKIKPAARVLAENSDPSRKTSRREPEPLIVVQPFGNGRTAYIGSDETWRWRMLRDGKIHKEFWTNMIRYLATLKARRVIITAGGERFSAGSEITVEVEAFDKEFLPLKLETYKLAVVDISTGKVARTVSLAAVKGKEGRFSGKFTPARTGQYQLTSADMMKDPLVDEIVASKRIRVELPMAESIRTESDESTMLNIASAGTPGLKIHEIDRLLELIPPEHLKAVHERPYSLWDTNLLLMLIAGLLVVEWVARKKYNLV